MYIDAFEKHNDSLKYCISTFDVMTRNLSRFSPSDLGLKGDDSNSIYLEGEKLPEGLTLIFTEKAKNCSVFIGNDIAFKACKFSLKNKSTALFLGKESTLNNINAVILGEGDFIAVGEAVSVTAQNTWSTGFNAGKKNNGIIIGDHCLIASEVVIRPADGHLVIDVETSEQKNVAYVPVIIEPYCWIAQRAAVLKNVRVGACSIISFSSVVTKSCDKFSVISGVPGKAASLNGKMWLRGRGKEAKRIQEMYKSRFYDCEKKIVLPL
ncbi:acyltransferase [Pantoea anthophila]|uniref:acyltransferase n=1 Tax=Pantoea anthophila TaxID=470931 RepID=UPI00289F80A6|nr:acyltransferase [Pantoea anthophila]